MPQETTRYDLLIIPQRGEAIPGPHLTDVEARQALKDWAAPAGPPGDGPTWTVAFAHADAAGLAVTSTLDIPRTA